MKFPRQLRWSMLCMLTAFNTHCTTQRNAVGRSNETVYGDLVVAASFSPDNDGVDDAWKITNLKPDAHVLVYTFYGELVYENKGAYTPWNGTYKGTDVPAGRYYYVINIRGGINNPDGWVTLKRKKIAKN